MVDLSSEMLYREILEGGVEEVDMVVRGEVR